MSFSNEPIAIVGMSCRYPGAKGTDLLWHTLRTGPVLWQRMQREGWGAMLSAETDADGPGADHRRPTHAALLEEERIDPVHFGIPPIHASALARMQLILLDAANDCLIDAGYDTRPFDRDATDVICGTSFGFDRTYANALRIEAARVIETMAGRITAGQTGDEASGDTDQQARAEDERPAANEIAKAIKQTVQRRLRPSAYDRIGEMASTIPARIAVVLKLRGRTLAIDAADGTSFAALSIAVRNLRAGSCNLALVACGQRIESPLLPLALAHKRLLAPASTMVPFTSDGSGFLLGEGIGALLLKRLDDALRDGDSVYAVIRGLAAVHAGKPGSLRYPTSVEDRTEVVRAACRNAGVLPSTLGYVECFGSSIPGEQGPELASLSVALRGGPAPVRLGCVKEILGHTFANAGMAAISKVALSLRHGVLVPQHRLANAHSVDLAGSGLTVLTKEEPWDRPAEGSLRRAGINAASLTGTLWHVVLEEAVLGSRPSAAVYGPAEGSEAAHIGDTTTEEPLHTGDAATADAGRSRRARPLFPGSRSTANLEPIAVIGMGCSFPDAPGTETFWLNNVAGLDSLRKLPGEVFDREAFYDPRGLDLFRCYSDIGGIVYVPQTAPDLFRIPPRRWLYLDPAQRLALTAAAEMVRRYGYPERPLPEGNGACIVASSLCLGQERAAATRLQLPEIEKMIRAHQTLASFSTSELDELLSPGQAKGSRRTPSAAPAAAPGSGAPRAAPWPTTGDHTLPLCQESLDGFAASGVAVQIANQLGLRAVPMIVEAACASSLAAIDLAVAGLRSGEIDHAICGGVELPTNERDLVLCSALRLLSRDRIRPFDAKSDGFSAGSGIGLLMLKRLSDARASGDRIWATIRGVGASNDARSLVAPDVWGQTLAMQRAFAGLDIEPASVGYIETHGTGTEIGDQVEALSIALVYGRDRRPDPLMLGSVKSLIGHTFAAAGAAGALRAILALAHRTIPTTIGIRTLNRRLGLDMIPAQVCTKTMPWTHSLDTPRRAAVSAFGTGGINYHLILEESEI